MSNLTPVFRVELRLNILTTGSCSTDLPSIKKKKKILSHLLYLESSQQLRIFTTALASQYILVEDNSKFYITYFLFYLSSGRCFILRSRITNMY